MVTVEVPISDFEDEELEKELKRRGYYVSEYEPEPEDFPCEVCEQRREVIGDDILESIHYCLVTGRQDEAVQKVKDLIYDQIGRIS